MFEKGGDGNKQSANTEVGSLADFGVSLFDSAIARPYNATIGTIAPKIDLSKDYNHNSYAAKIGDFGGSAVDILVLSKFAGAGVSKTLGSRASWKLETANSDSPPVDFAGWAKAIDTVRGENAAAAQRAPEASSRTLRH